LRSELLLLAALALPEPASPPTEAHVALPRWDPQGQSLAYALVDHQELRGELWLLPPAGPPSRVRPASRSSAARGFEGGRTRLGGPAGGRSHSSPRSSWWSTRA
jgi:hypothetical protein